MYLEIWLQRITRRIDVAMDGSIARDVDPGAKFSSGNVQMEMLESIQRHMSYGLALGSAPEPHCERRDTSAGPDDLPGDATGIAIGELSAAIAATNLGSTTYIVKASTDRSIMNMGAVDQSDRRLMRPHICPGVVSLIDTADNTGALTSAVCTTVRDIAALGAAKMISPSCVDAPMVTITPARRCAATDKHARMRIKSDARGA